jgi:hypothetical protein
VDSVASSAPPGEPSLRIEQSGNSELHAGTLGGIVLAMRVCLMPLKSGIIICDYDIAIPGCDAEFFLTEPPEGSRSYRAFPRLELEFELEGTSVLNHRILRSLPIDRQFDGFLLAQSFDRLPRQFQRGMLITAEIVLFDQRGNLYNSKVQLTVDWHEQNRGSRGKRQQDADSHPHSTPGSVPPVRPARPSSSGK